MAVENGWGQGAVNNTNDYGKAKANSTNGFGKIYETSNAGLTNIIGGSPAPPALAQVSNVHSMSFDGTSNFVDLGSSEFLDNLPKASFTAWFNTNDITTGQTILNDWNYNTSAGDFGSGHFSIIKFNNSFKAFIKNNSSASSYGTITFTPSTSFVANTWYHLVAVFDGTLTGNTNKLRFYLNGQLQTGTHSQQNLPSTLWGGANSVSQLEISRWGVQGTLQRFWDGKLDEIGIFNVALTDAEILSIYNATAVVDGVNKTADLNDLTTPPVAWYRM